MIRLYFQQALYHLRENPIITWVSVLGTALAICMIMVLVITFQVRLIDCEPEVNRSRSLYVSAMSVKHSCIFSISVFSAERHLRRPIVTQECHALC